MYERGNGVARDYAEAVNWYRGAAEKGFPPAQSNLGVDYENGRGVPQDYAEAANWYRKAAEQGLPLAQNNLGSLYARGLGVPKDYVRAWMWFSLSAAQYKGAENNLALVARQMTTAQYVEAQRLASEWRPNSAH
jgi:TPR repeat protein